MNAEPITTAGTFAFMPDQNHLEVLYTDAPTAEDARWWGVRRGEMAEVQRITTRLYPRPSHIAHTQPDGSWQKIAWTKRHDDPETVEIVARYKWTGREWRAL